MKILQLGRYFTPHIGGTENVMFDLSMGASTLGIKCDVLCCSETSNFSVDKYGDVNVFRTKTLVKFGSIAISLQQINFLRKISRGYDIIHVHHPAPIATIALLIVRPKCKIVVTWHSDIVKQKLLLQFYKHVQNWLIKRANLIVATSPNYIQGSKALMKYPPKTTYVALGVPMPKPVSSTFSELKDRYIGKRVVFSLGRLVEYKGYEHLIDAAKYLDDSYIILIGGHGHLKDQLSTQIKSQNLDAKVKLLGRLQDREIPDYYSICDVFCLSSVTKNEAFGLVLAEAMSYAKPIVATRIEGSGVDWVNQDMLTGRNVPVGDPKALATAIDLICKDDALKKQYAVESEKRYRSIFTKDKMIDSYIELYKKMAREN